VLDTVREVWRDLASCQICQTSRRVPGKLTLLYGRKVPPYVALPLPCHLCHAGWPAGFAGRPFSSSPGSQESFTIAIIAASKSVYRLPVHQIFRSMRMRTMMRRYSHQPSTIASPKAVNQHPSPKSTPAPLQVQTADCRLQNHRTTRTLSRQGVSAFGATFDVLRGRPLSALSSHDRRGSQLEPARASIAA
jgi:hypothetical protein